MRKDRGFLRGCLEEFCKDEITELHFLKVIKTQSICSLFTANIEKLSILLKFLGAKGPWFIN